LDGGCSHYNTIRAQEKLEKDVVRILNNYRQTHSMMEALIKAHKIAPIGASGEIRPE